MNTSRRLWQHPNGCWQAEPGRKRRRSRGRRDQAEAQKLYRRLKAAFLLNQITFQDGTGYPIYEDTGEFVEDEDTLQNYWPATGPTKHILWGAIAALNARRDAKVVQREPAVAPQPSAPQVNNVTLAVAPAPISAPAPALQAKKTLFKKGQPWSKERKAQASARYQAAKAAPVTE